MHTHSLALNRHPLSNSSVRSSSFHPYTSLHLIFSFPYLIHSYSVYNKSNDRYELDFLCFFGGTAQQALIYIPTTHSHIIMSTDWDSVTKIGKNVSSGGPKATVARSQSEVSTH